DPVFSNDVQEEDVRPQNKEVKPLISVNPSKTTLRDMNEVTVVYFLKNAYREVECVQVDKWQYTGNGKECFHDVNVKGDDFKDYTLQGRKGRILYVVFARKSAYQAHFFYKPVRMKITCCSEYVKNQKFNKSSYRKALRVMKYVDHHGLLVITFIDTAGAFADFKSKEL
ncbi:acetyl-coenzyme A carboxylase carboxyl transferase subunit alpha, chloroplastic-like protein, partial [Tanacetum coccineum]